MNDYILSCCSTADLTQEHFDARNIHYICFHYFLDGKQYADDLGKSMPFDKFYQAMVDGADTKTSQINTEEFIEYFTPFLKEGKDILHLTLSSGITGVYNSACIARDMLLEEYPDRKIYIVDSLAASSGFGLLMDKLADLRDEGMDIDELAQWAEDNKLRMHHWFFTSDLTFFVKGGRVSKVSGWFGTALKICPLLNVSNEGKLIPRYKVRGKNNVIQRTLAKMKEVADGGIDYADKCYISNSACYADARALADLIEATFPKLKGRVEIYNVGTTIGSHTGPGTVALFFWGQKRVD